MKGKGQSHDQLRPRPFPSPSPQAGERGTEREGRDIQESCTPGLGDWLWEQSPHCTELRWRTGCTPGRAGALWEPEPPGPWRTSTLCWSPLETTQRLQFERLTSSRKCARGAGVGGSSLLRRKGRWATIPQPSFSPTAQAVAGASPRDPPPLLVTRHRSGALLPPASPGLLSSAAGQFCWQEDGGRTTLSQLSRPSLSPTGQTPAGVSSKLSTCTTGPAPAPRGMPNPPGMLGPAVVCCCWLAGRRQPCPQRIPAKVPHGTQRAHRSELWNQPLPADRHKGGPADSPQRETAAQLQKRTRH